MNIDKLFQAQKELDEKIIKEKGLENMDRLPYLILALQVELGELANEWRGFKFWSENQEPIIFAKCWSCSGQGNGYFSGDEWTGEKEDCIECLGTGINKTKNPLLEEYVDCLHFILSIGLVKGFEDKYTYDMHIAQGEIEQFNWVFNKVGDFFQVRSYGNYKLVFDMFICLGDMLGFTQDEIEKCYFEKNLKNHERQATHY